LESVARHFLPVCDSHRSRHRQLNEQSAGEDHGDGEKTLCDSCSDLDFVHDVLSEMKLIPHAYRLLRAVRTNKLNG
jgi:hypothetical protein